MHSSTLLDNISSLSAQFATERAQRQCRRSLCRSDFDALREAGYLLVGVPVEQGGLWEDTARSTRLVCQLLRTLAGGDSSVALVCAMHPAVLSYWLTTPSTDQADQAWQQQRDHIFQTVRRGAWWGTITSEPGSGGDVARTRAVARCGSSPLHYYLSGPKHFGSGSGIMDYMVTTAVPEHESDPDWFFLNMQDVPWDGSAGVQLVAPWDGHGMIATQSHALCFDEFPATRIAWPGNLPAITARCGGLIGCLFSSVIVGIVDAALQTARQQLEMERLKAFERVQWARAEMEGWLLQQAYEGILRAVQQQHDARRQVLQGKTAIAELAESVLDRLCKTVGGGSYARRSPFGFWFQDVRALGFLRPPWGLAFEQMIQALSQPACAAAGEVQR